MYSDDSLRNRIVRIGLLLTVAGCLILLYMVLLPRHGSPDTTDTNFLNSEPFADPAIDGVGSVLREAIGEVPPDANSGATASDADPGLEFVDSEILRQADEAVDKTLFDSRNSDPREFVKLEWYSGVHYKTVRRLITDDKLPVLHELLKDRNYAQYWDKVALLIGYASDDPCSVPVLLEYFQRDDSWNWTFIDRAIGIPRIAGKISALVWIGKIGGDEADTVLREAVTEEGALRLADAWIDGNLLETSSSYGNKENVVTLIRCRAAQGLAYSGKPENIDIVKRLYAEEDARCREDKKVTKLYNGLVDAMSTQAFIADNSRENLLESHGEDQHSLLRPYIRKYAWNLKPLE